MMGASHNTVEVETFHGGLNGSFGGTLIDGRIVSLTLPMSAVDPSRAEDLGNTLVDLLNGALDKHIADLLNIAAPEKNLADPDVAALDRFVAKALTEAEAMIAASPSLQRDLDAALAQPDGEETVGHSSDGAVETTLLRGRLQRIAIDEHLLATSRPARVADAVISAVHSALDRNVSPLPPALADLTHQQLADETTELHRRIADLEGGRP